MFHKKEFSTLEIIKTVFCFLLFSVSTATAAPIDKLSAKIVYQKTDGIYELTVGEKTAHRLVNYGTNPRWSPDGQQVAFIHGNAIMLLSKATGKIQLLARAVKAKSLCFYPDGKSVVYTDNKLLRLVTIANGKIRTLLTGGPFYELDMADNNNRLTVTVKTLFSYKVQVINLQNGSTRTVSKGCSASLSPDGNTVTVNSQNHRVLSLFDWKNLTKVTQIHAAASFKFDNQLWSNNPEWLSSTTGGDIKNIYLHHLPSDSSYRITSTGDCDRADLYVQTASPD